MAGINYAEERAYWYLRLNGFFLLTDFVVHKSLSDNYDKDGIKYHRDVDLIGVRFPHVYEEIGGQLDDFDEKFLEKCGMNLNIKNSFKNIAVICEVKSGEKFEYKKLNIAMEDEKTKNAIKVALKRLGVCPECGINHAVIDEFSNLKSIPLGNCKISKILFSKDSPNENTPDKPYYIVNLNEARNFILKRLNKYLDPKFASRMFFNSVMMQEYCDIICTLREKYNQDDVEKKINDLYP